MKLGYALGVIVVVAIFAAARDPGIPSAQAPVTAVAWPPVIAVAPTLTPDWRATSEWWRRAASDNGSLAARCMWGRATEVARQTAEPCARVVRARLAFPLVVDTR